MPDPRAFRALPTALSLGLALSGHSALLAQEPTRPTLPGFGDATPEITTISPRVIATARRIVDPAERALALQRLSRGAILGGQLDVARETAREAGRTALLVQVPLVRDQRLVSTVNTLLTLAEELLRVARTEEPLAEDGQPLPSAIVDEPMALVSRARSDWIYATDLAGRIGNPTYRAESLYRVVESQAFGSQSIASSLAGRGERGPDDEPRISAEQGRQIADGMLVLASTHAREIDRPIWRNRALLSISSNAAASGQYERALVIARTIPLAEPRSEALIRIGEAQATRGNQDEATRTYSEAAATVAAIPSTGLRSVLAGVLIDNLIAVGRFQDARTSVYLYEDDSEKLIALGAVAESMGRRGLGDSAIAWIDREIVADQRSVLYRRVGDGILAAVEQNRSRSLGSGGLR